MIDAQLPGGTKILRNIVSEHIECMLHFHHGLGGGFRTASHICVIEVCQSVGAMV